MNKIIFYLLTALIAFSFAEGLFGPLYALFVSKIGGGILDISWAWSSYLVISGILTILFGKFSDKLNKKVMIVVGSIIAIVATFSYLLVLEPWHLFFVQIGLGVASAMIWPIWDTFYSDFRDKEEEGFEWGLMEGGWDVASGISILFGGLIVTYLGFQTLFLTMGVVQIFAFIAILFSLKHMK